MQSDLAVLLVLAFIGSIAGLIGGILFLVNDSWGRLLCKYAVPFAAGVLLTIAFIDLLPESVHQIGERAYLIVLFAFLISFIFEHYIFQLHHHERHERTTQKSAIPLVVFGDTIHNFIDGIAIAAAFMVEPVFGLVVALASFLHETPHEIGDFGILRSAGWSKRKTILTNAASASATFLGALIVYFFASDNPVFIGSMLAISAGLFLYLGATDFLPEVGESKKSEKNKKLAALLVGVFIMAFITILVPHGHEEESKGEHVSTLDQQ